jgi:hypothetical protein
MSTTRQALLRLKRRVGREAARAGRWADDMEASATFRERCSGEANVLRLVQGFIDDELKRETK